jgi:hypothetical protein
VAQLEGCVAALKRRAADGVRGHRSLEVSAHRQLRVRVEIMGSQKCGIVGESQSALMMIDPIIFTRTRTPASSSSSSAAKECRRHVRVYLLIPACRGPPTWQADLQTERTAHSATRLEKYAAAVAAAFAAAAERLLRAVLLLDCRDALGQAVAVAVAGRQCALRLACRTCRWHGIALSADRSALADSAAAASLFAQLGQI